MQTAAGTPQGNVLRIGRVVKSYSNKHVVDVVFLDDGGFASGVPVSTQWGSQEHGFHYLPEVDEPPDGHWSTELSNKNDALALVGYFSGQPFVVGMIFPTKGKGRNDMYGLANNELLIQQVLGPFLKMDAAATVTLSSILKQGNMSHGSTLYLALGYLVLFNNFCSLSMDSMGAVEMISGGGNKIKMDPSGAISMKSGGGAVVEMGADGIIRLNPSSPSDPV